MGNRRLLAFPRSTTPFGQRSWIMNRSNLINVSLQASKLLCALLLAIALTPVGAWPQAKKIKVGYSSDAPGSLVTWLAHETGIFAKNGLEAELVRTRTTIGVMALLSGAGLYPGFGSGRYRKQSQRFGSGLYRRRHGNSRFYFHEPTGDQISRDAQGRSCRTCIDPRRFSGG